MARLTRMMDRYWQWRADRAMRKLDRFVDREVSWLRGFDRRLP